VAPRLGRVIVVLSVLAVAASTWYAFSVRQEQHRLQAAHEQTARMLQDLQLERAKLNEDLAGLSEELLGTREDLKDLPVLEEEVRGLKQALDGHQEELNALRSQYEDLRAAERTLRTRFDDIAEEKAALEQKLNTAEGLKRALREFRTRIRAEREAAKRASIQQAHEQDAAALAAGNRGLVVRQGVSTLRASRVGVRVHPVEPQPGP